MRKTLLFLMVLSVKLTFGQVSDDFSDGNLDKNPQWSGDFSNFSINSSKQLQTTLSSSSQSVILTVPNLLAVNVKWEFAVQLNFDPSSSNQAKIYLISDQSALNGTLNGYFIQIGESGSSDSYDLYRQNGETVTKIIDGLAKPRTDANKLMANIRVTRDHEGKWELFTDITAANQYNLEGTVTDATFLYTDWFGVHCKYTSTRSDGFIFDDFRISQLSPDVSPPILLSAKVIDDFNIEASFSERLMANLAVEPGHYLVTGLGNPTLISPTKFPNVFRLTYPAVLKSGGYQLEVNGLGDIHGNLMDKGTVSFFHLEPYEIKNGDILISELLANPKTGSVDFVEIYNATNQMINIKDLQLGNVDANGNVANLKLVSSSPVYMRPKTYWVLTSNGAALKQQYLVKFPSQLTEMQMPAYNNDKGTVILKGGSGILDRFDYKENMHSPLLQNQDGVSLERASFAKSTNETGNFRSAAMSVGFATPSYHNSQELDLTLLRNKVTLAKKTFSPDGDGFEDSLEINYEFVDNNQMATVNIYSDQGILVRKLQRNTSIATAGNFKWDGLSDQGVPSKIGIYVVKFDALALNGKMESFKRACVLAGKLN
jgi:hypothetical protein